MGACQPNFELITANTGKQCLGMVKDNKLDIVILGDLTDMAGLDVIEQIRSCSEVPVMVLSSICDEPLVLKAFASGADGYMTKSFHQLELVARVRALLRRSQTIWNVQDKRRKDK